MCQYKHSLNTDAYASEKSLPWSFLPNDCANHIILSFSSTENWITYNEHEFIAAKD